MPKNNERLGRLLTCAEAAEMLGLKEATVRVWIARRKLTYVKLSRSVRVPADAVEDLIMRGTMPAHASK
jgi:excisionase family DNA binding protein